LQLNMGEGKTRVIMPMVALELCGRGDVVRLNFLSQLLPEALSYLHACLTGVICNRDILFVQGFEHLFMRSQIAWTLCDSCACCAHSHAPTCFVQHQYIC
jgi:hypothetical protein